MKNFYSLSKKQRRRINQLDLNLKEKSSNTPHGRTLEVIKNFFLGKNIFFLSLCSNMHFHPKENTQDPHHISQGLKKEYGLHQKQVPIKHSKIRVKY